MNVGIEPVLDGIFVTFTDEVADGKFHQKTQGGIIISGLSHRAQTVQARWGKVAAVGPKVRNVKAGDFVLIQPGMWTTRFKGADHQFYWKTDEGKIQAVSDYPYEITLEC